MKSVSQLRPSEPIFLISAWFILSMHMTAPVHDTSRLFVEIGAAIVLLAILARLASRWGFSAIPLYLLAGLAFGNGGLAPLPLSQGFIGTGAEIGVLLLLFMLGLEYSGEDLKKNLRFGLPAGLVDFVLNFTPGLVAGLLLRWKPLPAVLLGGITYISSSGVIAKVLAELKRINNPETPMVLAVLVLEDLAMAVYLPLVGVLLIGGGPAKIAVSVSIAVAVVMFVLFVALQYGQQLSRFLASESDEIILLTTFGTVLLVAGLAERFQVSAAIGAFLVGIALSGPIAEQSHRLLAPLRDLFAATFFFFFGLQIDPATLPAALPVALGLGVVTAVTKVATGYWAAKRAGVDKQGSLRAGTALVARGEFSIVIAGLGVWIEPSLGPLAAAYVLFLAILGPILARLAK
jgi:CPA2 family monovalent cation:H+ antiporter-2